MDSELVSRWSALDAIRWGFDDCVPLVANELRDRTGADPLEGIRSEDGGLPYRTRQERDILTGGNALRMMLRGIGRRAFQKVEIFTAPMYAIGVCDFNGAWAVGMNVGKGWWAFRADYGLQVEPSERVRRAWIWKP